MDGRVIRLLADKGFGFIQGEDKGEYFFHMSAVEGKDFEHLRVDDAVTFTPTEGTKGKRAEAVRRLTD